VVAMYLKEHMPTFPKTGLTPFALAMPDEYKTDDPVEFIVVIIYLKINCIMENCLCPNWFSNYFIYYYYGRIFVVYVIV